MQLQIHPSPPPIVSDSLILTQVQQLIIDPSDMSCSEILLVNGELQETKRIEHQVTVDALNSSKEKVAALLKGLTRNFQPLLIVSRPVVLGSVWVICFSFALKVDLYVN